MQDLLKDLKDVLTGDQSLLSNGQLLKTVIAERASNMDSKFLELLLSSDSIKKHFFADVNGTLVFDKNKFQKFVSNKYFLPDNYTAFGHAIGLATGSGYLKASSDTVLVWPYKDCILEGGMSRDESVAINENFLSVTLAPDYITRLLEPKVLTSWERWDAKAVAVDKPSRVKNVGIADNLLIRGNNLLVLHSLRKRYGGKIKLIYIDPPYNRDNDNFKYNDKFKHSTWLTFMKNRLEIARDLLRDDGVIFVQCDDTEQAYLQVLMNDVFGREHLISTSVIQTNRGGRDYGSIALMHEYLLIYSKARCELHPIEIEGKQFEYEDEAGGFDLQELRNRNIMFNESNRPNLVYPFYVNLKNTDEHGLFEISLKRKNGFVKVMPLKSQGVQTVWRWGKEKAAENLNTEIKAQMKRDGNFMIVQKYRKTSKLQRSIWNEKEFVTERGTQHIKQMFNEKIFSYPKSEFLIKRVLELATQRGDIVLDFFLGSGTTAAVAHKMGRQYIGIEQMDYIKPITVERMKKVIAGEQGGVSEAVGWMGGGGDRLCRTCKQKQQIS